MDKLEAYNKTKSCKLCRKLFICYNNSIECCDVCTKNIIEPIRELINEYRKENPGCSRMDIMNSGIIKLPEGYKVNSTEFMNIIFNGSGLEYQVYDEEEEKHKIYLNAMERDLDKKKEEEKSKLLEDLNEIKRR